jgi:hypothetical protein
MIVRDIEVVWEHVADVMVVGKTAPKTRRHTEPFIRRARVSWTYRGCGWQSDDYLTPYGAHTPGNAHRRPRYLIYCCGAVAYGVESCRQ